MTINKNIIVGIFIFGLLFVGSLTKVNASYTTTKTETCRYAVLSPIYHCTNNSSILCVTSHVHAVTDCSASICGGAGKHYADYITGSCGFYCTNGFVAKTFKVTKCHYISGYQSWTRCSNGVKVGKNPIWKTVDGNSCKDANSTKACPFQCSPSNPPAGTTKCPNTTTGLTQDISWHKVSDCSGDSKCSYTKKVNCGSADGKYYTSLTSTSPNLCSGGGSVSGFDGSTSELPGGGWTWDCVKDNYDPANCSAKKQGECVLPNTPGMPPYIPKEKACKTGHLSGLRLNPEHTQFTWYCTTEVSNILNNDFSGASGNGTTVNLSSDPASSSECSCPADYTYSCKAISPANCSNHCGENVAEVYQAYKTESACFPSNATPIPITKDEYNNNINNHASGEPTTCQNKQVKCPPCGINDGESGTINETN